MVDDDGLEIFSFKDLFQMDLSLFRVYSGSGGEGGGDFVVQG